MRLSLFKICAGAMYFIIIGCSQLRVSGEFTQSKELLQMEQENVIRPGYYSYKILEEPEKSITGDWSLNREWENYAPSQVAAFPKKYNDLLKSPANVFKILYKLVRKSESLKGKQSLNLLQESRKMMDKQDRENKKVVIGKYERFPPSTLMSLANSNEKEINKNFDKKIDFGNYLKRIIQHSVKAKATSLHKINLNSQSKEIHEGIQKIRKVRSIFPPLTDFKSLQTALKAATYFEHYKDGNLSSFEHFNFHTNEHNFSTVTNNSQETQRFRRSDIEKQNLTTKHSAADNFLVEFKSTLEIVKYLINNGMFDFQVEKNDTGYDLNAKNLNATLDGKKVTRKIRQLNDEVDLSTSFGKKLIEMEKPLNQLTESLANERCGLERKSRETKHNINCGNYKEVSKIVKNLHLLLRDFVDTSIGDFRKNGNFDDTFVKLSAIKLKTFRSELEKLKKQLINR